MTSSPRAFLRLFLATFASLLERQFLIIRRLEALFVYTCALLRLRWRFLLLRGGKEFQLIDDKLCCVNAPLFAIALILFVAARPDLCIHQYIAALGEELFRKLRRLVVAYAK